MLLTLVEAKLRTQLLARPFQKTEAVLPTMRKLFHMAQHMADGWQAIPVQRQIP